MRAWPAIDRRVGPGGLFVERDTAGNVAARQDKWTDLHCADHSTVGDAVAAPCSNLVTSKSDLTNAPPRDDWTRLMNDATAIDQAASQAEQLTNDANQR